MPMKQDVFLFSVSWFSWQCSHIKYVRKLLKIWTPLESTFPCEKKLSFPYIYLFISVQTETFWRFTDGESSLLTLMRFWMLNTGNSSHIWLLSVCLFFSLFSCLINPLCLNPNEGIILPLLHIIKDTGENLITSDPTNSQIVISTRPESKIMR